MIRHLDGCKPIEHFDCADCTARHTRLVCNCAHNIARPNTIGAAYESKIGYTPGLIGQAETRYLRLRPLVDFAVAWMNANRT